MQRIFLTIVATAMFAHAAQAQENSGAVAEKDPVICKHQKKPNSRFTTKVCHTKSEWEAIRQAASATWKEARDRPTIETRRGG